MKKLFFIVFQFLVFTSVVFAQGNEDFYTNSGNFEHRYPQVVGTDLSTTSSWTALTSTPHAVSRSCCVYIKRNDTAYIFQFGGGSGAQLTNVARYNINTSTWTNNVSTMPANMSAASAITYGDSVIYVFGGQTPTSLGSTLKWNLTTNLWTTLAPMTVSPCTDELCVKYRDTLVYIIGGSDGIFAENVFSDVRLYNIKTNTWSSATSLPFPKGMMGGGILGDTIIAGSGWTSGIIATAVVHKGIINPSNPASITWTTLPNYPAGAVTRPASYLVRKGGGIGIVFSGGSIDGSTSTITNLAYLWNFCTQSWQSLPNNTLGRANYKGAGAGDSIFYGVAGFTASSTSTGQFDRLTFSQIDGSCGSIGLQLQLTSLIEGFYNSVLNTTVQDTIRAYLRNTSSPYSIVDSTKGYFSTGGSATLNFSNASNGTYYIELRHRNGLETWSATGVTFVSGSATYDFTTDASKAYGDNLVLKGTKYCIYSADVNQDGIVDGADGSMIDNDAAVFLSGYVVTDANGDQIVDGSDLAIQDNNAFNFIGVVRPPLVVTTIR